MNKRGMKMSYKLTMQVLGVTKCYVDANYYPFNSPIYSSRLD